jgi:hypothetical protein
MDPILMSLPHGAGAWAGTAMRMLQRGAALTDEEKQAITQMATTPAPDIDPNSLQLQTPVTGFLKDLSRYVPSMTGGQYVPPGGHYEPSGVSAEIEGQPQTYTQGTRWVPDDPDQLQQGP